MSSSYSLAVMYIRFGLANLIWTLALGVAATAIILIPREHPSRIFVTGRIRTTFRVKRAALSREAARAATQTR